MTLDDISELIRLRSPYPIFISAAEDHDAVVVLIRRQVDAGFRCEASVVISRLELVHAVDQRDFLNGRVDEAVAKLDAVACP